MKAPSYRWTCYGCQAANEAGLANCQACGFTASPDRKQLDARRPRSPGEQGVAAASFSAAEIGLFFPEAVVSLLVVIGSPIWVVRMLMDGEFLAAIVLFSGVAASVWGFVWSIRAKERYGAYVAMVAVIGVVALTLMLSSGE